jgi:hypothetical protein
MPLDFLAKYLQPAGVSRSQRALPRVSCGDARGTPGIPLLGVPRFYYNRKSPIRYGRFG